MTASAGEYKPHDAVCHCQCTPTVACVRDGHGACQPALQRHSVFGRDSFAWSRYDTNSTGVVQHPFSFSPQGVLGAFIYDDSECLSVESVGVWPARAPTTLGATLTGQPKRTTFLFVFFHLSRSPVRRPSFFNFGSAVRSMGRLIS